jgi:ATP-dependent protease HslVU (ClpYQ) peptidase subunit
VNVEEGVQLSSDTPIKRRKGLPYMTCIVGVIEKAKTKSGLSRVVIGADSAVTYGWEMSSRKSPKLFKAGQNRFLIGVTGTLRPIQILKYVVKYPDQAKGEDTEEFMATKIVSAFREAFKEEGYSEVENNKETQDSSYLIGYSGRLFLMESNFSISESAWGYDAIGCGAPYAKGAICALPETMDTEERIRRALTAADLWSIGVAPPFVIESI